MKKIVSPRIDIGNAPAPTSDTLSAALESRGLYQPLGEVNWDEYPYRPDVSLHLGADGQYLYVRFDVRGLGLKAVCTEDNSPVWQDSCVEIFIGSPDGCGYFNFEMNCIGTLLAAKRRSRNEDVVHFAPDVMSRILRRTSLAHEPFDEKEGIHDWSAVLGIPFALLGFAEGERPAMLRANFYKCADETANPHYVSWAPIRTPSPDFHRPEFFGELYFE